MTSKPMVAEFELVLPAYNEEKSLPNLLQRAVQAAESHGTTPGRFQLVVVNNGSTDDSAAVLAWLKTSDLGSWFRTVNVPANTGYGAGVLAGLQATAAPVIGWSHADLQCDPGDAFRALALLRERGEKKVFVKGRRYGRRLRDRIVTAIFGLFARVLLNLRVAEINAQPKVFHRDLLPSLAGAPRDFAFDLYALYRARRSGLAIDTVDVHFPPRIHGASRWAATFLSRYKTIGRMILFMWRLRRTEGVLRE